MKDSWGEYFQQRYNGHFAVTSGLREQLHDGENQVFDDASNFWIYKTISGVGTKCPISSETQLGVVLQGPSPGLTVVSVSSTRTNAALQISSTLASRIFHRFNVNQDFLRILLSFGRGPQQTDVNYGYQNFCNCGPEEYTVCYKLNFFERNARSGPNPWSSRHVGIYHHHDHDSDFIFLINCVERTLFLKSVEDILTNQSGSSVNEERLLEIGQRPESLHVMLLASYADNWKPYFDKLNSQFNDINDQAMVTSTDSKSQDSFDRVQSLRHLHDKTSFANACCDNNSQIARLLLSNLDLSARCRQTVDSIGTSVIGFRDSSEVLQRRIQNAIDMVGYNLTLHNQLETAKLDMEVRDMTRHMENLAQENRDLIERMKDLAQDTSIVTKKLQELQQDSVDDSGIVNIITIASVFYLPGSFVGTIFGMNFFDFDTESRSIIISDNFWIFVVTWLVFFIFTIVVFVLAWWVKKRDIPRPWRRSARKATFPKYRY